MMEFLGPLIAQLAGQQLAGGGGGMMGGGGQPGQGGQLSQQLAQVNPLFSSLKHGLDTGLKAPVSSAPAPQAAPVAASAPAPQAAQPAPDPSQGLGLPNIFGGGQQGPVFGGSVPAGNGGASGPLPGLGGAGPAPSAASNFGMIFPGAGGMGMASASPSGAAQGGLQQLLMQILRGGLGAGL